ncbi:Uncharacterized protein MTH_793 [Geodia barretti]|uniref:Uncharacterized protein MTH_793 n=1 Tax=Geodia barretti TaxID=519541 RepID=A0AA35WVV1_GEOBA|nr:Uncharacterized protein MTH_793 [Geodia barretti]
MQLASEAIKAACDDAGIAPQDIDGLIRYDMESNHETLLTQSLGIKNLRHWESVSYGGGAGNAVVGHAAAAIAAGYANYVVCFRAANLRSGCAWAGPGDRSGSPAGADSFAVPWGNMAPAHRFGMFVRRYMHQYGATSRHFGPITIDDHQNSRMVVDPLHVLDFCQENDGAAAVVMTTPERARELRHSGTLTLVEAAAQGSGPRNDGIIYRPDLAVAESENTARDLWARARLDARDMDALMFYDHFTPFCLINLEAYGFVPRGEAKDFVDGGDNIRFDGALPVNTHGGNHSEAYIHGLTHVQEAVRLIRGDSTAQPPHKTINRVLSCSSVPS